MAASVSTADVPLPRDYIRADWSGDVPCHTLAGEDGVVTVEASEGDVLLTVPAGGSTDAAVTLTCEDTATLLQRLETALATARGGRPALRW